MAVLAATATVCASDSAVTTSDNLSDRGAIELPGEAHPLPATLGTGDWVERTLDVPSEGDYDLVVDGTLSRGDYVNQEKLQLDVDGVTISANIDTMDVSLYSGSLLVHERLHLSGGNHVIRLLARQVAEHCEYWWWDEVPTCFAVPYRIDNFWLTPSAIRRAATILAGGPDPGFSDGFGSDARFGTDFIAVEDVGDSLLVGDSANHRIRRVTPEGQVSVVVGSGNAGHQDGTLMSASFGEFIHLAPEPDGSLWVLDAAPLDPAPPWPRHRDYHIRHVAPDEGVTTLWSGRVETGAPPMDPELLSDYGEPFYFLNALVPNGGQSLLIRATYWNHSAVVTLICGDAMSGRFPCEWYWQSEDVRHLLLVDADGILTNTGEIWEPEEFARNEAGVAFFVRGDRLLRQPPEGHPQTIYRNPDLRAVVSVRDEEVWIAEDARIMRVLDDTSPTCELRVEVIGGTGRVEGIPVWPVSPGTTVTLTAIPTGEAQFSHWAGDATGGNAVIELRVDQSMTVEARLGYSLEVSASHATVALQPDLRLYPLGLAVTLSATPEAGLDSVLWSDGAEEQERSVTVGGAWSVEVAGYRSSSDVAASLQTKVLPPNSGRVERTQFDPYHVGRPIWLSAVPSWGFPFRRWSDGVTEAQRMVHAPENPTELVAEFDVPSGIPPVIEASGLTPTGQVRLVLKGKPGLQCGIQQRVGTFGWSTLSIGTIPATGWTESRIPPTGRMQIYRAICWP